MKVKLDAELIMELLVECHERIMVGENDWGALNVIQISGGAFKGKINGDIVPGGADWNMRRVGTMDEISPPRFVFAKYLLKTDDHVYIAIENKGYKKGDETDSKIVTCLNFHAPKGKYEWLNNGVYVGSLESATVNSGKGVKVTVYKLA